MWLSRRLSQDVENVNIAYFHQIDVGFSPMAKKRSSELRAPQSAGSFGLYNVNEHPRLLDTSFTFAVATKNAYSKYPRPRHLPMSVNQIKAYLDWRPAFLTQGAEDYK